MECLTFSLMFIEGIVGQMSSILGNSVLLKTLKTVVEGKSTKTRLFHRPKLAMSSSVGNLMAETHLQVYFPKDLDNYCGLLWRDSQFVYQPDLVAFRPIYLCSPTAREIKTNTKKARTQQKRSHRRYY
ncbi:hypothetical protein ACFE04_030156 [Oxalis oulophora]